LREAYDGILSVLRTYSVPATFAFVGLYAETPGNFRRLRPEVEALAARNARYIGPALRDIDDSTGDGWHGSWAVDAVGSSNLKHEIALHGIAHVPWGQVDREFALAELSLHPLLMSAVREARTFVAPRNEVEHLDLLRRIGIVGYRSAPSHRSSITALISEFDIWTSPQSDPSGLVHGMVPIPSGYFINWQHGLRRIIPIELSSLRFDRMLLAADQANAVVHFWLHPENVASAPATLGLLRKMLAAVAKRREVGACEVLTQLQYVHQRLRALER
jgi:peptidoglycan/xylan/chitin deacetylase (PgdA/CDA1 family)